jgi:hypothetical protein
MVSEMERQE